MRFGFHLSIAGGFSKVFEKAGKRGCETIQFFSRNPRGWRYGPLDKEDVRLFRTTLPSSGLFPVFLHMPYLPNLASRASKFYARSVGSLITELERAEQLGAHYLILHLGHRMEATKEEAIDAVCEGLGHALESRTSPVILLLENTAGQGSEIGSTFEEIGKIIRGVEKNKRIGVCLDTAHAFAAGYDLSRKDGVEQALEFFDRHIGMSRLQLLHLNDSKTPLGSGADRHWHIGEGHIGLKGFRSLVNHPLLRSLPGIMETPRKDTVEDVKNMGVIRSLVEI
jgi:deoxyribonuclease-4